MLAALCFELNANISMLTYSQTCTLSIAKVTQSTTEAEGNVISLAGILVVNWPKLSKNHKYQPHGGDRYKVRGSPKLLGFILWVMWIFVIENTKVRHAVLHVGTGAPSCEKRALFPVPATVVTCLPFLFVWLKSCLNWSNLIVFFHADIKAILTNLLSELRCYKNNL